MKKIVYAILACIIIAGIVVICTLGLKADIIFSKNAQIDIYIGKAVSLTEIRTLAEEVFENERIMVQEIELFEDMFSITVSDRSDEELKEKAEQLNTKINEKYELENKADEITISHNPKMRLSSVIKPYIIPVCVSVIFILIFAVIRYKNLGRFSVLLNYILSIAATEAVYLSIIAITRFEVNRFVIPVGLLLYVVVVTILGIVNEKKLKELATAQTKKKK